MYANMRGCASRVTHTNDGVKPIPVSASRSTVRDCEPLLMSIDASLRWVSVPLGTSGSLPSGRLARAARATDVVAGVAPSGVYNAVSVNVCVPASDVLFQRPMSPSRVKVSSTGAPKVETPFTW